MNVTRLQQMDRWLGIPICFFLGLWQLGRARARGPGSGPPSSLLFVKLAEQGSTVLAYPALRRGVELAGRQKVYFLALEENRFILDVLELIPKENVITLSTRSLAALAASAARAVRRLRALKLDAAVDMEFFSRGSAALTFLSGARRRVGFHAFYHAGPYRANLMTHRLLYNPHLHTSETFLSLVEALEHEPLELPTFPFRPGARQDAIAGPDDAPQFSPDGHELEKVKALVRRLTGGQPPLLLLNPNASDLLPLRRWPAERYIELAKRLLAQIPEVWIGVTGAPHESAVNAELARQVGSTRCVSFAGQTTLRELLVLYTLANVLVTNDSGPAHFATLTPVRVVTLFGPETPGLYAARTPRNTVLWAGLACSPCVNAFNNRQSPCRNNLCMQALTVEQVFAAACAAYRASRKQCLGPEPSDGPAPEPVQRPPHRET